MPPAIAAAACRRRSFGPPSSTAIRWKRSAAAPLSSDFCSAARPASTDFASFDVTSTSAPSANVTSCRRGSRCVPVEIVDRIHHLDGIAGGRRQRLVHVGDERGGRQAGAVGDLDQRLRQRSRVLLLRHEGAGPGLDVEHQRTEPGGELLRQDRGGDQRDRLDRRRHVADGVEALVGRREVGRLADDGAAGIARRVLRKSSMPGCEV